MKVLWLDTTAGVAGDMVLAALIDAGADLALVQQAVDAVAPGSVRLSVAQTERQGQRATKLEVEVLVDDPPHRTWASIRETLMSAALQERTRELALATFGRLAHAEGRVHGVDPDEVHFHEVGALDSIADVVGACEALRLLGVDEVIGTPVAVGEGRVRVAHGVMPIPVPAVAELALGWPTTSGALPIPAPAHGEADHKHDVHGHEVHGQEVHGHGDHGHDHEHAHTGHEHAHTGRDHRTHQHGHPGHGDQHHADAAEPRPVGELATPTGMALVRAFASRWSAQPAMVTSAIGVGAGTKDTPGRPNVVRVLIGNSTDGTEVAPGVVGDPRSPHADDTPTEVTELQANVDDLDPRLWPGVLDRLLEADALDAWLVPILMKRGRPAHTLHVLCRAERADALTALIFATTTTLGVRRHVGMQRSTLERSWTPVQITVAGATHEVRIKVGSRDGVVVTATPEFADVAAVAAATGIPEVNVLHAAQAAAYAFIQPT